MSQKKALLVNPNDDVAVTLFPIKEGDTLTIIYENNALDTVVAKSSTDAYHKIAIRDIEKNDLIKKYGEVIGRASKSIERGEWVHVFNLESVKINENKSI